MVQKFKEGVSTMLSWGVCPGQSHCARRWWPQPWAHRARGAGGPLRQLWTEGWPRTELACLPTVLSRGQLAPPRSTSGTVSARGSPAGTRKLYPRQDQSPRGLTVGALPMTSGSRSPEGDREGDSKPTLLSHRATSPSRVGYRAYGH